MHKLNSFNSIHIVISKLLIMFIVLAMFGCARGQIESVNSVTSSSTTHIADEHYDLILDKVKSFPENTQLSIALVSDGIVKYFGVKRMEDTIQHVENHQGVFEIGSISKVFTSTLLASFVQDGSLGLDDNIEDYLDYSIKGTKKITFRNLANHTSGLPRLPSNLDLMTANPNNPYKDYDSEKLVAYLSGILSLDQDSIVNYGYSNLGAGTLGYTLAELSKNSYDDLLQEKIFSKYLMTNSTTDRQKIEPKLIKGLNYIGEEVANWDLNVLAGAGAILSTTEDLSKFLQAQLDEHNKELLLTQQPTYIINDNMKIGLGWHLVQSESGNELLWHNGGTGGYTSSMVIDKENANGVVILSNVSAFNPDTGNIDKLCFGLVELLKAK